MPFLCVFCEKERCYFSYLCDGCREQKHLKLLYGDRYDEIVKNVLLRTNDKQEHKIKVEIKKDIEHKKKEVETGDETYITKPSTRGDKKK
tara:strand:+ start:7926 stop:8195 length:270 start_codon:yes stop_codon:yes gene_type:complete